MPFWCTLEGQFGYGRSSSSGFSPTQIPGLTTWYDASDLTTMYDATSGGSFTSNGGRVALWLDKSGNGNNATQYTGQADTTRPILNYNVQNGRGALQFSQAEARQLMGGTGTYPFDVYIILETDTLNSTQDVLAVGSTEVDDYTSVRLTSVANWGQNSTGGTRIYTPSFTETSSNFLLLRWTATNTTNTHQIWRNGTWLGTSNFSWTFPSPSKFLIGSRRPNLFLTTNTWNGQMGEILIYDNQLNIVERQLVEGYLCWKWGIQTSLPAAHPYRSNAPQGLPFTPCNTNNLALWLDSGNRGSLTLTSENLITTWNDLSSGWSFSQATSANQPLYTFSGLSFDGSNDTLTRVTIPTWLDMRSNYDIFFVNSLINSSNNKALMNSRTGALDATLWELRPTTRDSRYLHRQPPGGGTSGINSFMSTLSTFTTSLLFVGKTSSTLNQYLNTTLCNSVPLSTSCNFSSSFNQLYIGSLGAAARYHHGLLSEMLIYNTNLDLSTRQQVEGYLAAKWMIQSNLPASHPYRTIEPLKPQTPFQPTMVNNLKLWFDASDSKSLTLSGSTVTQLIDKSGNGNSTSNASGTTSLITNSLNNLNTLQFTNSFFTGPLSYTGNTITTFFVGTIDSSSASNARLMSYSRPSVADSITTNNTMMVARNIGCNIITARSNLNYSTTIPALSTFFILCANQRDTYASIGVNGATPLVSTNTIDNNFNTSIYGIGQNAGGTQVSYYGNVAEVLVYFQTLNDIDRQDVEGYLAWKWGLQSLLPSTHPFKSNAP